VQGEQPGQDGLFVPPDPDRRAVDDQLERAENVDLDRLGPLADELDRLDAQGVARAVSDAFRGAAVAALFQIAQRADAEVGPASSLVLGEAGGNAQSSELAPSRSPDTVWSLLSEFAWAVGAGRACARRVHKCHSPACRLHK